MKTSNFTERDCSKQARKSRQAHRTREVKLNDKFSRGEVYVINVDGSNPINLTQSLKKPEVYPEWSPDGQQIAFTSDRDGNFDIYVMNADGTNPINLTNHLAEDSSPAWSPDGTRIAFQSIRDGNFDIYVMAADGANPINLTNHPAEDSGPAWGPAPTLNVSPKRKLTTMWGKLKTPH